MKYNPRHRVSEAQIQAEFYHQCQLVNIKCVLGYTYWHLDGRRSLLDCIVVDDKDESKLIVEFKSFDDIDREPNYNTKQIKKYEQLNVPILIISRIVEIRPIIDQISLFLENNATKAEWLTLKDCHREISQYNRRGSAVDNIKASVNEKTTIGSQFKAMRERSTFRRIGNKKNE